MAKNEKRRGCEERKKEKEKLHDVNHIDLSNEGQAHGRPMLP
jgi:hypothetical protein